MINQLKLNAKLKKTDGDLFRFEGKKRKLIKIDVLDELYEDKSIREYLNELEQYKICISRVLKASGIDNVPNDLDALKEQIFKTLVIDPNGLYVDAKINTDNYIIGSKTIKNKIVKIDSIPLNIDNGCYEVIEHNVVLDEEKIKQEILL